VIAIVALAIVGLVVAAIVGVTLADLVWRPTFRRLAFRNALRRKNEALLVVLGSLFGTAIVTSAFVVGDTLQASLRDEARTRLGPIDEIVLVHRAPGLAGTFTKVTATPLPGTDGVLTMVTAAATVASVPDNGEPRRAEPNAFVHEVDFDDAREFGGRPGDTGFVDAGPTPTGDDAVISRDLADGLGLQVGDRIDVYLYGQVTPFRVRGVVPRLGVAGFHPTFEPDAQNVFVAPGTLQRLAASATGGASDPEGRIFVSNTGGVFDGAAHSDDITLELQIRTVTESGVEVTSEKQGALDFADRQGRTFTQLFGLIGGFIVVAGVLLLVNIFVMLAEERKSELGMLRALGLKRNHLVRTFGLEGNLYAIAAAIAGSIAGVGVGRVVVSVTERIFAEGDRHNVLQFSVKPTSIAIGFAIGLVISLLTVWGTSLRIGLLNVIRAIRDVPEPPKTGEHRRTLVLGVLGLAVGLLVFAGAVSSSSPMAALVGPAIALWSAVPVLAHVIPRRAAVSVPCLLLIVYEIVAFGLLESTFRSPGIEVFFAQGVILVFTAVVGGGSKHHHKKTMRVEVGR
jgi:putative ABC transport system permease protein